MKRVYPVNTNGDKTSNGSTSANYITEDYLAGIIVKRDRFSHKGTYGHALLIAGSYGKMGAAVLSSKACMRSGVGLLTVHIPGKGYEIMQISVPEAMCSIDSSQAFFSEAPVLGSYTAVGIGPGLGKEKMSEKALKKLLEAKPSKIVLDADALNIMANQRSLLELLPENSVLTPHLKEFERLTGVSDDSGSHLQMQLDFSKKYKVFVVLKGANTCITSPDGEVWINTAGNPGMATAGCGDVLTGIILALLAQNHSPLNAAQIGVFVHGLAGDIAAQKQGEISLIASDLVDSLGMAFHKIIND